MARYRKIDPRIWNDAKFRALSDQGKLAFLFLLTHPHMTSLGAMRATPGGLAEELGWSPEAFREAFREAFAKGMAEHDEEARMIALPNFIRYNPPESPNVIKAWLGALDLLPECSLKTRVIARAKAFAEGLGEAFREALPEAFAKGMPYPEQEQEQEQKIEKAPSSATAASSSSKKRKKPAETPLPEDFKPSESTLAWAAKKGYTRLDDHLEHFIGVAKAKGYRYADWQSAFQNAVRSNWAKINGNESPAGTDHFRGAI